MSTVEAGTLFSQFIYEAPKDRPVNFYCPEFQRILDIINGVLFKYTNIIFSFDSAKIIKSKFDTVQKFKCKSMWRVTSDDYPALNILCHDPNVKAELITSLNTIFPQYIGEVIKVNNYGYDTHGRSTKASIVIMPGGLIENTFTAADIKLYDKNVAIKNRLDSLEDRMYRRKNDTRSKARRFEDFDNADDYEPVLPKLALTRIFDLALTHSTDVFSIDPPEAPDYIGKVDNLNATVEAKSTRDNFNYEESAEGKAAFAIYWKNKQASLGSLHNANYILFVFKTTGQIVCIERLRPENNWLAGALPVSGG
jgi:hypothetical protein